MLIRDVDGVAASGEPPALVSTLVLGALTVSLAATLGVPLIPTIATELDVTVSDAQWLLTITLLVGAVSTPVVGRLGDGERRKTAALGALACVAVGCVVSAMASNFAQLMVGRAMQGLGYGVVPLMVALSREHLAGLRLDRALSLLSVTVAVGAGLGFPATSMIAEAFGFQGAYWAGAVFALTALIAVHRVVPRSAPRPSPPVRIDAVGALLLGGGLGTALLAISRGEAWGWGSPAVAGPLAAGLSSLVLWAWSAGRVREPLVDLRLAVVPAVMGTNAAALFMGCGMFGSISLINRIAQTSPGEAGFGLGASVATTGFLLLPLAAGAIIAKWLASRMLSSIGPGGVMATGAVTVAVALVALALVHTAEWHLAFAVGLIGVGSGATFAAMPAEILARVPAERTGSAMALNQILRVAGGAVGSASSIAVLHAFGPGEADVGYTAALCVSALSCACAALASMTAGIGRTVAIGVDPVRPTG